MATLLQSKVKPWIMLKNYFKIAWRNLTRHKTFSVINILGLSIGIAVCLMIFLYVRYELTYDQYNVHADRIARITSTVHVPESDLSLATCPYPLARTVQREFPEVESAARLESSPSVVNYQNELIREHGFYQADQSIFTVFTFSFIEGTAKDALTAPRSLVLTESIARKYFGSPGDAIGETLTCSDVPFRVTAVVAERPTNSDIKIDGLLSADFPETASWMEDFPVYTFVLFKEKLELESFEQKLQRISARYVQPELDQAGEEEFQLTFEAEALSEVHFSQGKLMDTPKGSKQFIAIFSILAIFILVIALLNYINLSTAKATERAKEVGIRKVSGAHPFQLIRQFLVESFLLIVLAWIAAVGLVLLLIPYCNQMLDIRLSFSWQQHALSLTGVFLATALLTAFYPAFVLSRYRPANVLNRNLGTDLKGLTLRKGITVTQFVIAVAMTAGTLVVYKQLQYLMHTDRGFDLRQVLSLRVPTDSAQLSTVNAFYDALQQQSEVQTLTAGNGVQEDGIAIASTIGKTSGGQRELMCNYFLIDPKFISLFGVQLKAGRNLSASLRTDRQEAFLVNEAFVHAMGWSDAIGQPLEGFGRKGKVVGIVKNFYYKSMHNLVEPLAMIYNTNPASIISLRVRPKDLPQVKAVWQQFFPGKIFDYTFLDEAYAAQYQKDKITMHLFNYFTLLAILVSCLGLYGLVSWTIARRVKEIGIRKVLGATISSVVVLLSRDFIRLVLIAVLIASPIAWLAMSRWLENFAYRIELQWWMFALAGLLAVMVALLTVSVQSVKAALMNPMKSLRSE